MVMDGSKYPDNWEEIAREYKDKVNWTCEICGRKHMEDDSMSSCLTVHHKNHDPENPDAELEALCAKCHLKQELAYKLYGDRKGQGEFEW